MKEYFLFIGAKGKIILFIVIMLCNNVYSLTKKEHNLTYNDKINNGWEIRQPASFTWKAGDFLNGWVKKTSNGSAAIVVLIQTPGYTISEREYSDNMSISLSEIGAIVTQRQVEMVAEKTAYWLSVESKKGVGKSPEGGNIPTRSTWVAVPNGPDILVFYFSAPTNSYKYLLPDFKKLLDSVKINKLEDIDKSNTKKSSTKKSIAVNPIKESESISLEDFGIMNYKDLNDLNDDYKEYGLTEKKGIVIISTKMDSPLAKAGIRTDTLLLELNKEKISNENDLNKILKNLEREIYYTIKIIKKGKKKPQEKEIVIP